MASSPKKVDPDLNTSQQPVTAELASANATSELEYLQLTCTEGACTRVLDLLVLSFNHDFPKIVDSARDYCNIFKFMIWTIWFNIISR